MSIRIASLPLPEPRLSQSAAAASPLESLTKTLAAGCRDTGHAADSGSGPCCQRVWRLTCVVDHCGIDWQRDSRIIVTRHRDRAGRDKCVDEVLVGLIVPVR